MITLFDGSDFKIYRNEEIKKIQLFFNEKPSEEIRTDLKQHRWWWSSINKAWERNDTQDTLVDAERIKDTYFSQIHEQENNSDNISEKLANNTQNTIIENKFLELVNHLHSDAYLLSKFIPVNQLLENDASFYKRLFLGDTLRTIPSIGENPEHKVALHYFDESTDIYITEQDKDESDTLYGFTILNGDTQNAEWGYSSIEETIHSNPSIKLAFYHDGSISVEETIHKKYPTVFPDPYHLQTTTELLSKFIPPNQFSDTPLNMHSSLYETIYSISGIGENPEHKVALHYFIGATDIYITEQDKDDPDIVFGFNILNGDAPNAEWGYSSIEEITHSHPFINLDYYHDKNISVERARYEKYPNEFSKPESDLTQVENQDIASIETNINNIQEKEHDTKRSNGHGYDEEKSGVLHSRPMDRQREEHQIEDSQYDGSGTEILPADGAERRINTVSYSTEDVPEHSGENEHRGNRNMARAGLQEGELGNNDRELLLRSGQSRKSIQLSLADIRKTREECTRILLKDDSEISDAEKKILSQYEGAGGLHEENSYSSGVLSEFYTPNEVIARVWQVVDAYAPDALTVLEPSAGTGRFTLGRENNQFALYELDDTAARIAKVLNPESTVINEPYQKQFFDASGRVLNKKYEQPKYDIVIGNPPYGEYKDRYKGLGEGIEYDRYEEYFISRGLAALKNEKSILAFVVPSGFLSTSNDKQKALIAAKGELLDAWRLPEGTFPATKVGTDIIFMKKGSSDPTLLSNNAFFKNHPERILGEVKQRQNRFGKLENFVVPHEELSIFDELQKIEIEQQRANIEKRIKEQQNIESKFSATTEVKKELSTQHVILSEEQPNRFNYEYEDINGVFKNEKILSLDEFSAFYTDNKFSPQEYLIWRNTDWKGIVDTSHLSDKELQYLQLSNKYLEVTPNEYMNIALYTAGNIYEKIEALQLKKDSLTNEIFEKCLQTLENAKPQEKTIDNIRFSPLTTLANEFYVSREISETYYSINNGQRQPEKTVSKVENLPLKEDFLYWASNSYSELSGNGCTYIADWTSANIRREDIPENIGWGDIADYVRGERVKAKRVWNEEDKKDAQLEANKKRATRRETAEILFERYLHEGLPIEDGERLTKEWNKRFNANVNADYAKLPVFVDGMKTWKDGTPFKLFRQQIKGVSFLTQKGNGLLAYDVGVGKTASGIVSTVAQVQSKRSKRPLIVVPKAVYSKWYHDLKELFPNIQVNDLENFSEQALEPYHNGDYGLNIPNGSISICTNEALQRISFEDESIEEGGVLFNDFANLLGKSDEAKSTVSKERAKAVQTIQNEIGKASQTKDNFVFFERCGFDHLTVDEAHRFKNLFRVPRSSRKDEMGDAQEFAGLGTGSPSKRAMKMFGMTQLVQHNNDNRNVFLLTATPFTNSPLEIYSMLSYLAREKLKQCHIYDIRDFCAEFVEVKTEDAVNPKGEIKSKSVMKSFRNISSLQNLLQEFIDKVDGEEAGVKRPLKEQHQEQLEFTNVQKAIMAHEVERMLDPESVKNAGTLVAMNNMRMACVSPTLLNPNEYSEIEDFPTKDKLVESSPKLTYVCDTVTDVWKEKADCGQIIYMPYGVTEIDHIKEYLVKNGINEKAIGVIAGSGLSEEKIDAITSRFNDKKEPLKILIGSKKIAEGMDLNGNSIALYNTMLDWNPTESVQVEGRLWRQGNNQAKVHIMYPLMEDSIESLIFQKHDEKSQRINSVFDYKGDTDTIDVSAINPEELKFDLIKDPEKKADYIISKRVATFRKEIAIIDSRIQTIDELETKRVEFSQALIEYDNDLKELEDEKIEKELSGDWGNSWQSRAYSSQKKSIKGNVIKTTAKFETVKRNAEKMDIDTPEKVYTLLSSLKEKREDFSQKMSEVFEQTEDIIEVETRKLLEEKAMENTPEEKKEEMTRHILSNTWEKSVYTKNIESEKEVAEVSVEAIEEIPVVLEQSEIDKTLDEEIIPSNIQKMGGKQILFDFFADDEEVHPEQQSLSINESIKETDKFQNKLTEENNSQPKPLQEPPEYIYSPTTDKDGIIDYTAVQPKKIYLANKKNILQNPLPSYLPPVEVRRSGNYDIPALKIDDNTYLLKGKTALYRVSLDVYAALTHYHLEYDRAAQKTVAEYNTAENKKALAEGKKRFDYALPYFSAIPEIFDIEKHTKKYAGYVQKKDYKPKRVSLQSTKSNRMCHEVFYFIKEKLGKTSKYAVFSHHKECIEDLQQKLLDMELQKNDWETSWTKGRETAYGDSNLDPTLFEKYGVSVKRQNGDTITSDEKNELSQILDSVYSVYGDISSVAKDFSLKISHAGNTRMHASKAIGFFSAYQKAIGVSFAGGVKEASVTLVHEFAHFTDHIAGEKLYAWHASDIPGTLENIIAVTFREKMQPASGDYWGRTCECFARAMEEHSNIEFLKRTEPEIMIDKIEAVVSRPAYMHYQDFQTHLNPLIAELLEKNKGLLNTTAYRAEEKEAIPTKITPTPTANDFDLFEPAQEYNSQHDDFYTAINDYLEKGIAPKSKQFVLRHTPDILQYAGLSNNGISLSIKVIAKAQKEHHLSNDEIRSAVKQLLDPVLIFDTDNEKSEATHKSVIVITNAFKGNKPLVLAIATDTEKIIGWEKLVINDIRSIHDRTLFSKNGVNILDEWNKKGLLKYVDDKKITDLTHGVGIYFPLPDQSVKHSIKTKSDYVNNIISENLQKYITSTDPAVTRDVINNSKAAQRKYTRAMKNLVKNGWDSFRKFEKHGVFDITGQTVGTDAKGKITNDGWVQMAQAMRIYRDKHFETFRFAFVDKEGTVQDQITVCSCMPNKVLLGENLVKDVLEYAERTNTSVVAVHNHPSGNTNQSVADTLTTDKLKRQLIDSNGKSLFQGHIILDHNTFGLYDSLGNEWKEIDSEVKGNDPLMKQHLPSFTAQEIRYPIDFKKIAESINSDDKWNCKDWVPVLFTDSSIKVSSIRYYPKKTLEGLENSEKIKEMFRTAGKSTGTTRAFLIVPDELSSDKDFLNAIQIHTMNGCFTDFYMDGKTSEYYALDSHKTEIFDGVSKDELRKNTVYSSTFTPPSEVRGHTKKSFHVADPMIPETVYSIANIKKGNIHSDMNLLLSDYFMHHKYFPPMIEKNGNIHLYCSVSDISNTSRINSTGQLNHNDTVEMVLSKKQIAVLLDYALKEKVLRHKKDPSFKIDIAKRDGINSLFDNVIREIYPDVSTEKRINNYMTLFKTIEHELKDLRLNDMQKVQQKQHKKIYNSGMGY